MNYGPWRSVFGPELQLIKAASPQKGHVLCSVLSRSVLSNSLRPNGERRLAGYSPWGFSRQEYWSGCCILQGIFPTQRLNLGLPHCRQILYHLSHQGKPKNAGVGSLSLLQGIFPTEELNWGLLDCRQILYQLDYQGSPRRGLQFHLLFQRQWSTDILED